MKISTNETIGGDGEGGSGAGGEARTKREGRTASAGKTFGTGLE